MTPCPTGWGYDPAITVKTAKLAVECGLWYLAEFKNNEFRFNFVPKEFKPVEEYLKLQRRFRHLDESDYREIEANRDAEWNRMRKRYV